MRMETKENTNILNDAKSARLIFEKSFYRENLCIACIYNICCLGLGCAIIGSVILTYADNSQSDCYNIKSFLITAIIVMYLQICCAVILPFCPYTIITDDPIVNKLYFNKILLIIHGFV